MRKVGSLHPTEGTPVFPDTVGVAVISSAAAVVAMDYPTGANLMHFDAHAAFWFAPSSTTVAVATTSQAGSTSQSMRINQGHEWLYQITPGSTGYSITAETTGVIGMAFWAK